MVTWNLKELKANLRSDEQKSYKRQRMRIRLRKKLKSYSYYLSYGVNMADRWKERVRTLTGEVSLVCTKIL